VRGYSKWDDTDISKSTRYEGVAQRDNRLQNIIRDEKNNRRKIKKTQKKKQNYRDEAEYRKNKRYSENSYPAGNRAEGRQSETQQRE
jgi:hypothetical protein